MVQDFARGCLVTSAEVLVDEIKPTLGSVPILGAHVRAFLF